MKPFEITRRTVLKALGFTGAGAGAGLSFQPEARAAAVPKRILFFYAQMGEHFGAWEPQGEGSNWQLNEHYKALAPFKEKLIFLRELEAKSAALFGRIGGSAHKTAAQHVLTPWKPNGELPGGISIDNFIADKAPNPGRIRSLAIKSQGSQNEWPTTTTADGRPRSLEGSPTRLMNLLFPGGNVPVATSPGAPAPTKPDLGPQKDKRVVDFLKKEYDLFRKAGTLDEETRQRFSAHLDQISDLERSLDLSGGGAGGGGLPAPTQSCARPSGVADEKDIYKSMAVMNKLASAAFACDVTRVIYYGVGWDPSDNSHDVAHSTSTGSIQPPTSSGAQQMLKFYTRNNVNPLVDLLTQLASIKESDGKSVLDHTVVVYMNQIANGNHSVKDYRIILAGSGGGHFKTNQVIRTKATMADLYISLANYMGIEAGSFGAPGTFSGPIGALKA